MPYRAQFQNREFFSRNNNASNEQFSLAPQYVSSSAPSALLVKETCPFAPPSRILDVLKTPIYGKVKHERPVLGESERSL